VGRALMRVKCEQKSNRWLVLRHQGWPNGFLKCGFNWVIWKKTFCLVGTDWKLAFGIQKGRLRAARLRSARVCVENIKPQGGVRFRSSSARKESSGERERGARPCGVTVRGCIPRGSLRRIPKQVADYLKFIVLFTCTECREWKQSEII
jgi:hypothetical protein